ncbi:hypothetical protein [Ectobacillus funiculus]|uniref:Uncharacterized protein n=1 Tax=Ectobacillus funiculus TaxID=137993 RepID=A0ABV5WLX2_9BACI
MEQDLEDIRKLAGELSEVNDTQKLRELHEYFHDIDVVMNGNYGEGDFFGITKWVTPNK